MLDLWCVSRLLPRAFGLGTEKPVDSLKCFFSMCVNTENVPPANIAHLCMIIMLHTHMCCACVCTGQNLPNEGFPATVALKHINSVKLHLFLPFSMLFFFCISQNCLNLFFRLCLFWSISSILRVYFYVYFVGYLCEFYNMFFLRQKSKKKSHTLCVNCFSNVVSFDFFFFVRPAYVPVT